MAPSAERSPEGEELTRKENRAAWGIPRDGRSEAQPKWVPESRADHCIKLKTLRSKRAALKQELHHALTATAARSEAPATVAKAAAAD